jgi:Integrase core domain
LRARANGLCAEQAAQAVGVPRSTLYRWEKDAAPKSRRPRGAWRYEFHQTYELPGGVNDLNPILDSFQHLYNHHRPHGALAGSTPAQYLAAQSAKRPPPSHMC